MILSSGILIAAAASGTSVYTAQDFPDPIEACEDKRWVCATHYPKEARNRRWEGDVSYELTIGIDGKPTGCRIRQSSGHSVLDRQTCAVLLANAKFNPATDKDGKPAIGKYRSGIHWLLPELEDQRQKEAAIRTAHENIQEDTN